MIRVELRPELDKYEFLIGRTIHVFSTDTAIELARNILDLAESNGILTAHEGEWKCFFCSDPNCYGECLEGTAQEGGQQAGVTFSDGEFVPINDENLMQYIAEQLDQQEEEKSSECIACQLSAVGDPRCSGMKHTCGKENG